MLLYITKDLSSWEPKFNQQQMEEQQQQLQGQQLEQAQQLNQQQPPQPYPPNNEFEFNMTAKNVIEQFRSI
ncbi:uncharacterized protein DDB_G0288467-like [Lucilia cuprina]|uniref:uncharacterized protein DDB_G0288467-like n=1 Tax=Lucilia cuprina TaxID=7375 RepID=UPI001F057DA9|nr:uncharacterized protein DDB_G0288467-like [Lucilia cuprina]XP_046809094.1 uncharacterized protein DDB_G0288467-like [Lucilia cuprina]XP_046809096.1 uncharacterized protein DDB_G0288467-like [Lucilia cuprina]